MHQKVTFGEDGSPGAVDAWTWLTAHTWSGWDLDVVAVKEPLKGTSDSMLDFFFANMSERASKLLRDDMEVMGPVRLKEEDQ